MHVDVEIVGGLIQSPEGQVTRRVIVVGVDEKEIRHGIAVVVDLEGEGAHEALRSEGGSAMRLSVAEARRVEVSDAASYRAKRQTGCRIADCSLPNVFVAVERSERWGPC